MRSAAVLLLAGLLAACSGSSTPVSDPPPASPSSSGTSTAPVPTEPTEAPEPSAGPTREPRPPAVAPAQFDADRAFAVVRHLAGDIGPRHGTSVAFTEAARWVEGRFERLGLDVRRQRFDVPGGDSWGVLVEAGPAVNVIATPPGFDPHQPHLVVGAHLDTVPQAPGAEDNASGVGVMLAAAEATSERRARLPVVWVAFGAEEPRGPGDDDHHYGSRAYVAEMTPRERDAMRAMVSLDRVGVGATMPVGSAGDGDPVQRSLLAAAERAGVSVLDVAGSRSSDHWSFVRNGLPAARLGSTSYAAYHSPSDLPDVIDVEQLGRAGRIVLAWLAPTRP